MWCLRDSCGSWESCSKIKSLWKLETLKDYSRLFGQITETLSAFNTVVLELSNQISHGTNIAWYLKADFFRTGKRTYQGLMMDGYNSALRYYLNNFQDGYRQDSYDLFLGNYSVDADAPSPYAHTERSLMVFSVEFKLTFSILLSCSSEL